MDIDPDGKGEESEEDRRCERTKGIPEGWIKFSHHIPISFRRSVVWPSSFSCSFSFLIKLPKKSALREMVPPTEQQLPEKYSWEAKETSQEPTSPDIYLLPFSTREFFSSSSSHCFKIAVYEAAVIREENGLCCVPSNWDKFPPQKHEATQ